MIAIEGFRSGKSNTNDIMHVCADGKGLERISGMCHGK